MNERDNREIPPPKPARHTGPCTHFILSRRAFLGGTATALASVPFVSACEFAGVEEEPETLPSEITFDAGTSGLEDIATVGGVGVLEESGLRVLLIRNAEDMLLAFDGICPHHQLPIDPVYKEISQEPGWSGWDQGEQSLVCNHHWAQYGVEGEVLKQPITPPPLDTTLTRYEVDFDPNTSSGTLYPRGKANA